MPRVAIMGGSLGGSTAALQRVRWLGDTSQLEGSWTAGDPDLRVGLYGRGR